METQISDPPGLESDEVTEITPANQNRATARPRASRALPTDRLKFSAQVRALKAIVLESSNGTRAVGADEISKRIGVVAATAGLNNAFFLESGLVKRESKGRYKPTTAAISFNQQLGFDEKAAKAALAKPLADTWFFGEVKKQIAMDDASESRVIAVLANAADADDSHRPKLTALLDWLQYAGLIEIVGGQVRLIEGAAPVTPVNKAESQNGGDQTPSPEGGAEREESTAKEPVRGPAILEFNFETSLTAEDMAQLTPEQIKGIYEAIGSVMAIQAVLFKGEQKQKK